jgi:hypothetical protein
MPTWIDTGPSEAVLRLDGSGAGGAAARSAGRLPRPASVRGMRDAVNGRAV